MIPMLAHAKEIEQTLALVDKARAELRAHESISTTPWRSVR
jgi:phosphoenolpyruvate-protein kinase (PTS system EI component)